MTDIRKPSPGQESPLLEVKNLKVEFSIRQSFYKEYIKREKKIVHAVNDISFNIGRGEIVSLVGESGSGKTTTGRAILQLVPTTSGEILFNGEEIRSKDKAYMRDFRKQAQMIFQDPYQSLNPRFTVFEIVTEPSTSPIRGPPLPKKSCKPSRRWNLPACGRPSTTSTAIPTNSPADSGSGCPSPPALSWLLNS